MIKTITYIKKNPILILLLSFPLVIMAEGGEWGELWVFTFSAIGVIPCAYYIGESTEVLAHYTGPRLGGLLNATLGNAAELIITIMAIRQGLLELVKASITGSILGNLLLVLGMAMLLGGIKNGVQTFDRRAASRNAILLVLTVIILLIPSLLSHYIGDVDPMPSMKVEALSLGVAGIMILMYGLGLLYSFREKDNPLAPKTEVGEVVKRHWSIKNTFLILAISTIGVAYLSEILVSVVEPVVARLGISEFFIGVIFIPLIGNVAEHLVSVQVAMRNKMTLSVEIAISSSLQIALFVSPILVFISLLFGHPLTLVFNQFELIALIAGVLIAALVSADGESNWLEGSELLAIYIILGLVFFLL
ncbi:MAG: calcium/proton exchanger [Anaerolineales bacterium]|nr:calcium/proton exchanger [Anaerolineales bacterium]